MPLANTDDVDVAAVLIDHGCRLDASGGSIGTPLDNAIGCGCWHVARLLAQRARHCAVAGRRARDAHPPR
jgi:hypothetical protein